MIESLKDKAGFEKIKKEKSFLMVIFYSDSSQKSKEAVGVLEGVKEDNPDIPVYSVNASKVKDIHPLYGIDSVPAVLVLKDDKVSKIIYGLQNKQYYEIALSEAPLPKAGKREERKFRSVTVYTTPSCPWCSKVKTYLMKNRIPFRGVDISRDERAAQDLMRRSGQRGVPQTDIDGKIVVGFDKMKLDSLLGIRGEN